MDWILNNLNLLLIPIISAVVGWATNYLAVQMMFYPLEFVGIFKPYLGWQGLIPSKRIKMAEISVDLVLGRLLSVEELAKRIDPQEFGNSIERRLHQIVRRIINDVMEEFTPALWAGLPVHVKELIYKRVESDIPNLVDKIVTDFQYNVTEIIDIKELVVEHLNDHPELINEIFLSAGSKEFPFIIQSGFYFGFLFGLPTMVAWYFYEAWWILPLGGLIVGYATNWIALQIIFEPKEPMKIGPMTIQGMFLKRQPEVADVYSDLVERKLLTAENISKAMLKGSGSNQLLELIELHVKHAIERYVALAQPYLGLSLGSEKYFKMKNIAVERIFKDTDKFMRYGHEYSTKALRVGDDLKEKMLCLSPSEFENVLRPAYKQDEWKLIIVGSLLGAGAGVLQLMYIFV